MDLVSVAVVLMLRTTSTTTTMDECDAQVREEAGATRCRIDSGMSTVDWFQPRVGASREAQIRIALLSLGHGVKNS